MLLCCMTLLRMPVAVLTMTVTVVFSSALQAQQLEHLAALVTCILLAVVANHEPCALVNLQ